MEGIKMNDHKRIKITIDGDQSLQIIKNDLNKQQSLIKLKLSITLFDQGMTFEKVIAPLINQCINLQFLDLKFNYLIDQDIVNGLKEIQTLTNLKTLSMTFQKQIVYTYNQSNDFTLGQGISKLFNLEELNLNFQSNMEKEIDLKLFSLEEAYKNLKNLQILSISISNKSNNLNGSLYLTKGIKNQRQLKQLIMEEDIPTLRNDFSLDNFIEEIKHLVNLTDLTIILQSIQDESFQQNLNNSLKCLENIERLQIQFSDSNFQYLKNDFSVFENMLNLKELDIQYREESCSEIPKNLACFSRLINLTRVCLNLQQLKIQNQQDFKYIIQGLSYISNLYKLQIHLQIYQCSCEDFVDLILSLKNQKQLKELQIFISTNQSQNKDFVRKTNMKKVKECVKVIKQLDSYGVDIYEKTDDNSTHNLYFKNIFLFLEEAQNLKQLEFVLTLNTNTNNKHNSDALLGSYLDSLTNLTKLKISLGREYNQTTEDINNFFKGLSNTTNLSELILKLQSQEDSQVSISYEDLSISLMKLINLKKLDLMFKINTKKEAEVFAQLSKSFKMLKKLKKLTLWFEYPQLSLSNISVLFENLHELVNLKQFNAMFLNSSIISNEVYFIPEIQYPKKIYSFELGVNQTTNLKFEQLRGLFNQLSSLKYLTNLSIQIPFNELHLPCVQFLQNILEKLQRIENIEILFKQFLTLKLINLFEKLPFLRRLALFDFNYFQRTKRSLITKFDHNLIEQQESIISATRSYKNDQPHLMIQFYSDLDDKSIDQFKNIMKIYSLNLEFDQNSLLSDISGAKLFSSLKDIDQLKELIIKFDQSSLIGENSLVQLGKVLPNFLTLEQLNIVVNNKGNTLIFSYLRQVFEGFGCLRNLKKLKLHLLIFELGDQDSIKQLFYNIGLLQDLKLIDIKLFRKINFEQVINEMKKSFTKLQKLSQIRLEFQISKQNETIQNQYYESLKYLKSLHSVEIDFSQRFQHKLFKLHKLVRINQAFTFHFLNF